MTFVGPHQTNSDYSIRSRVWQNRLGSAPVMIRREADPYPDCGSELRHRVGSSKDDFHDPPFGGTASRKPFIARGLREFKILTAKSLISSCENGYAESFHSKVRDEFLSCEVFESLTSAVKLGASWRRQYNELRPHSSLGHETPAEFARTCVPSIPATPQPPFQEHTFSLQT